MILLMSCLAEVAMLLSELGLPSGNIFEVLAN